MLLTECYWGVGQVTGALVGEPEGKRPLVRPGHRWEDNIKMDIKYEGWNFNSGNYLFTTDTK